MKKEEQMNFSWFVLTEDVEQSILLLTEGRRSIYLSIDYFKPAAYFYILASVTPDSEPEKLTKHQKASVGIWTRKI